MHFYWSDDVDPIIQQLLEINSEMAEAIVEIKIGHWPTCRGKELKYCDASCEVRIELDESLAKRTEAMRELGEE